MSETNDQGQRAARGRLHAVEDKLPPHSVEAEQGVLGCVLLSPPECLDACAQAGVTEAWFYELRHQQIYAVAARMHRVGVAVDLITLQQQLRDAEQLEPCGGLAYLSGLPDQVPSAANLPYYLDLLREKYLRRMLVRAAVDLGRRAYEDEQPAEGWMGDMALEVSLLAERLKAGKAVHIKDAVARALAQMEEHYTRGRLNIPPGYLPTGFSYMDKVTGGLGPEELMILAARPGAGKTTLQMDMIWNLGRTAKWMFHTGRTGDDGRTVWEEREGGVPIGVFSLEMSDTSLAKRILFRASRVNAGRYKQGFATKEDFTSLVGAAGKVSGLNVWLDDTPGQTMGQIAAKARMWQREFGIKLFMLDYLQLVRLGRRSENRNAELEEIVNQLVLLKKGLKVPWVVATQMNRDIEKSETHRAPVLADIKDCGAIEQAADHVFFLYRPAPGRTRTDKEGNEMQDERAYEDEAIQRVHGVEGTDPTEMPVRINGFEAKNRDGATGIVKFLFHRNRFEFEDWHDWETANGVKPYGKGERRSANPSERE